MGEGLTRFGLAIEPELLEQLDALAEARGCTRSELLRDLARAEVARASSQKRVPAVAAVTLVYNHHVRELSERLTSIQHDLGDKVRSAMHVHLDHDNCMEVIVLRGPSDELKHAADRMLGTRGVTHGGIEMVDESALASSRSHRHAHGEHAHAHTHGHAHAASPRRGQAHAATPKGRATGSKKRSPKRRA
ncbi:MAG: nickel-responsive transcriptional regulator NikR [Myxococcales bacterium]